MGNVGAVSIKGGSLKAYLWKIDAKIHTGII